MSQDATYTGAIVWQVNHDWAFFFRDKHIRKQVIIMCREQLGKGHHVNSAWHTGHAWVPQLPDHPSVPVIFVRNADMVTQLKLMYT
jgi:hypothetical protein